MLNTSKFLGNPSKSYLLIPILIMMTAVMSRVFILPLCGLLHNVHDMISTNDWN